MSSSKFHLIFFYLLFLFTSISTAQTDSIQWWNPAKHNFNVVEGQGWHGETESDYDRLPARAKGVVRDAVWGLAGHNAGIMIRFRSNAEEIIVRYQVEGNEAMNHMPATGVSGVDLYAIDNDGKWSWCRGQRSFADTITYQFKGLSPNGPYHNYGSEFRLYLPLYNKVKWLEIGVKDDQFFKPLPVRLEKPVVVYGTSIAQGGCASRPGMAWTGILERKLDQPLINLAFSGNGRLEQEVVNLIGELDAQIFVLDCLPNLTSDELYPEPELSKRITETVRYLREKHPKTPILLVEHAGYTDGPIMPDRQTAFERVNDVQRKTYAKLLSDGVDNLHYLSHDELGLTMDDMVDGTHPNDLGMQHYAEAYEKKLREILHTPIGNISTTKPVSQYREPDNYDWENRHRDLINLNRKISPKTVFIANSIIHFWGGEPDTKKKVEAESWDQYFTPMGVRNFAYGWDRIENVLWRIYHGELDDIRPEKVLVMIGTNNLHLNSDAEIIQGLKMLMEGIKVRQPNAEIIMLGLLPRRNYDERIFQLNEKIAQLASSLNVSYNYIGDMLLGSDQKIDETLFSDGLHPNAEGYRKMRAALLPILK
ncbi:MAG: SGNH/GDSL hydrolase family protein [Saprospiraceae bacterium]|nr:SGNH/GDSL hydrolase family protein [Saprospiraceae bacterium]